MKCEIYICNGYININLNIYKYIYYGRTQVKGSGCGDYGLEKLIKLMMKYQQKWTKNEVEIPDKEEDLPKGTN